MPSGARSGETERAALLWPGERQAGMREQLLGGELTRMAAFEDRPGGVGGKIAQPQHAGEVGACQLLALCKVGEIPITAAGQPALEEVRPGDQLDQFGIRFCRAPR